MGVSKDKMHGQTGTRLYNIWAGMKARCYIPTASGYKNYGARGITVCDEWKNDFRPFLTWAQGNGYSDSLSIERKDNNQGYTPENCCWILPCDQPKNTSQSILITHNNKTMTLRSWARYLNMQESTIRYRYHKGLPISEVLSMLDRRSNPEYYGKTKRKRGRLRVREACMGGQYGAIQQGANSTTDSVERDKGRPA